MPQRQFASADYRFGFNGKENDNEVKGTGNQQDYGMRIYDTRLVRFLSVDPLTKSYPWYTPYQFAGNKPIQCIDIDGLEQIDFRVLDIDKNGNAHVKIDISENTTSRSNSGVLLIHNIGNGKTTTETASAVLNQALGIDSKNPSQRNPNVVEGVGGTFTPDNGSSDYYLQIKQSSLSITAINYKREEGNWINQRGQESNISSGFELEVPPDPAPVSTSGSYNLAPPGTELYSPTAFTNTILNQVDAQANSTGQNPSEIKQINIQFPDIPQYQNDLSGLIGNMQSQYPNAQIIPSSTPVSPTGNSSISVQVTGSAKQNLVKE